MSKKLTPLQKRFVEEYVIDLNKTEAAIRAGFSKKTAGQKAWNMTSDKDPRFTHVYEAIQKKLQQKAKRNEIKADDVLKGLARIAFGDIRQLFRDDGTLKPMSEWSEDTAMAIASVEVVEDQLMNTRTAKIRTNDRLKALELIGKHLGMFTEKVDVSIKGSLAERLMASRKRIGNE